MYEPAELADTHALRDDSGPDLLHYWYLIRTWWWLILAAALIAGLTAWLYSQTQPKIYRATTTLLILPGTGPQNEFVAQQASTQLAESYVQRIRNLDVMQETVRELNLNITAAALQRSISASVVARTELLRLSVESENPQLAADLANRIPLVFADRIEAQQEERFAQSKAGLQNELVALRQDLANDEASLALALDSGDGVVIEQLNTTILRRRETISRLTQSLEEVRIAEARAMNRLVIDEAARVPSLTDPIRPRVLQNTLLAAVVGVMLALGVVFLIDYLDDTARDVPGLARRIGVSMLGFVPTYDAQKKRLIAELEPRAPATEAYRSIRMNMRYASVDRPIRTLLVTSAEPTEGKTTLSSNLGIVLASGGESVILVDGDLRRPNLHKAFDLDNHTGTSQLFIDSLEKFETFLNDTKTPGLRVVTSGPTPPNPSELLDTRRAREIVDAAARHADKVIIDAPPIVALTDSLALSQHVDGVILVVRAGKTSQSALNQALERLARVNANLIGFVVTDVDNRSSRYGGYYYYQYYSDGYANPKYFTEGDTAEKAASTNGSLVKRVRKQLTKKAG